MDPIAAARLGVGAATLLLAARSDVRTRRVSDSIWIVVGTIGLFFTSFEILASTSGIERIALVPATGILFFAVFFGAPLFDERGFRLRPMRIGAFALAGSLVGWSAVMALGRGGPDGTAYAQLLTMPAMVLVYQAFYQIGLLHGGADAKGLIALTLLVPTYPDASPFPILMPSPRIDEAMRLVFPFSLVAFVDAAILYLVLPVAFLVYNAIRRDVRLPEALFGYRAAVDRLPRNTWFMERIDEKGRRVLVLLPRRGSDPAEEARRLRDAGITRAWVQPKIPFMVPLTAGFVAAYVIGNLLTLILPG